MNATHADLIQRVRSYARAWSPMTDAQRRAILEEVWEPDARYQDPTARVDGRDAFADHLAAFQLRFPGARFHCSRIQSHGGGVYFAWDMRGPDDRLLLEGRTFAELHPQTGRFQRNIGFFTPIP